VLRNIDFLCALSSVHSTVSAFSMPAALQSNAICPCYSLGVCTVCPRPVAIGVGILLRRATPVCLILPKHFPHCHVYGLVTIINVLTLYCPSLLSLAFSVLTWLFHLIVSNANLFAKPAVSVHCTEIIALCRRRRALIHCIHSFIFIHIPVQTNLHTTTRHKPR